MNEINKKINQLKAEENIWIIYLIIIGLSFYSNKLERNYILYNNQESKNKYRLTNILIFSVALAVYCYFFQDSYQSIKDLNETANKQKFFYNKISFCASTLILVAGAILLYIAIFDKNLDTEIAFN